MKRLILASLALILASLACQAYFEKPANTEISPVPATFERQISTETPNPTNTPSVHIYTPKGTVNVRSCPKLSCPVVGHLDPNIEVLADCDGDWCKVEGGYVVAACLGIGDKPCQRK